MPTAGEPMQHRITRATIDPYSPDLTIGGFLARAPPVNHDVDPHAMGSKKNRGRPKAAAA